MLDLYDRAANRLGCCGCYVGCVTIIVLPAVLTAAGITTVLVVT